MSPRRKPAPDPYWALANDLSDGFLRAIDFLHQRAKAVARTDPGTYDLGAHNQEIRLRRRRFGSAAAQAPADATAVQLINARDPRFQQAVKLQQEEVRARIQRLWPTYESDPNLGDLRQALTLDATELANLFGSVSRAWDFLCRLKYGTSGLDAKRRAYDGWLVMLVTELERILRDSVSVAFTRVDAAVKKSATDDVLEHLGLDAVGERLLATATTEETVRSLLDQYMDGGSAQTFALADTFGRQLGVALYPQDLPSFDAVLAGALPPLAPDLDTTRIVAHTCENLLSMRRRIIHRSARETGNAADPMLATFYEFNARDLQTLADFVAGVGLHYTLGLLRALTSGRPPGTKAQHTQAAVQQWKIAGELRVLTLDLLISKRWSLAWMACEIGLRDVEPPGQDGKMLQLNALYARQKLGEAQNAPDRFCTGAQLREIIGAMNARGPVDPRHRLIQKSLLREFDGAVIDLLDTVFAGRDMSIDELEKWPALEALREQDIYKQWRDHQPRVRDAVS